MSMDDPILIFFWAKKNCRTREEWDDALSWRRKNSREAKKIGALYLFNEAIHDSMTYSIRHLPYTFLSQIFYAQLLVEKRSISSWCEISEISVFLTLAYFLQPILHPLTLRFWIIGEALSFVSRNYLFYRDILFFIHNYFAICNTLLCFQTLFSQTIPSPCQLIYRAETLHKDR